MMFFVAPNNYNREVGKIMTFTDFQCYAQKCLRFSFVELNCYSVSLHYVAVTILLLSHSSSGPTRCGQTQRCQDLLPLAKFGRKQNTSKARNSNPAQQHSMESLRAPTSLVNSLLFCFLILIVMGYDVSCWHQQLQSGRVNNSDIY